MPNSIDTCQIVPMPIFVLLIDAFEKFHFSAKKYGEFVGKLGVELYACKYELSVNLPFLFRLNDQTQFTESRKLKTNYEAFTIILDSVH